jgi:hypothetical protein
MTVREKAAVPFVIDHWLYSGDPLMRSDLFKGGKGEDPKVLKEARQKGSLDTDLDDYWKDYKK